MSQDNALRRLYEIAGVIPPGSRVWFRGITAPAYAHLGDVWIAPDGKYMVGLEGKWVRVEGEPPPNTYLHTDYS